MGNKHWDALQNIIFYVLQKILRHTGFRTTSQKNAKDDYGWWANLAYSRLFSYWTDFGDISERISKLFPRRFKYWTFRRRNKLLPSIHRSVSKQFKLKTNTSFHLNQTIKLQNQMWMQLHWPSLMQHEQIKNQSHKSFFLNVTLCKSFFYWERPLFVFTVIVPFFKTLTWPNYTGPWYLFFPIFKSSEFTLNRHQRSWSICHIAQKHTCRNESN